MGISALAGRNPRVCGDRLQYNPVRATGLQPLELLKSSVQAALQAPFIPPEFREGVRSRGIPD